MDRLLLNGRTLHLSAFVHQRIECNGGLAGDLFANVNAEHTVDHIDLGLLRETYAHLGYNSSFRYHEALRRGPGSLMTPKKFHKELVVKLFWSKGGVDGVHGLFP